MWGTGSSWVSLTFGWSKWLWCRLMCFRYELYSRKVCTQFSKLQVQLLSVPCQVQKCRKSARNEEVLWWHRAHAYALAESIAAGRPVTPSVATHKGGNLAGRPAMLHCLHIGRVMMRSLGHPDGWLTRPVNAAIINTLHSSDL